jgi:hypothetical protein
MEIQAVGTELFHANQQMDRRTAMTKLVVAVLNLATASKNYGLVLGLVNSTKFGCLRGFS